MEYNVARLERRAARIEADVSQLNARVANVEVELREFRRSLDRRLNFTEAGFRSELETQDEWRFLLLLALLLATVTLAAFVMGVLLSGPHAH